MSRQLDLFGERQPTRPVLAFPLSRQLGRARFIADKLLAPGVKDVNAAYARQTRAIFNELKSTGLSDEDAHNELRAFTDLVNAEVWRRQGTTRSAR